MQETPMFIGFHDCAPSIPPKADIGTQSRHFRFVPKAHIIRRSKKALSFNQLIGAVEQLRWDGNTKRFCGPEVDD
jgi:hypothetical protein